METKQTALITGSHNPEFVPVPHFMGREARTGPGKAVAINRRYSSHLPTIARATTEANPQTNPRRPPQRKNKTIHLRELQTLVPFPASTLRRMTRVGIFVKAARGATPTRKWNRGAVEEWIADPQLEVSWPASDAYGTDYDTDPEIRSHMRAILSGSTKPTAPARA